jgi:hypothetical protein
MSSAAHLVGPRATSGFRWWAVAGSALGTAALHLVWWWCLSGSGGDLAAQDAWSAFARAHPLSAYDFAWYGGMHPASYSLISPYVMSVLGVRATVLLAGTASAAIVTALLVRLRVVSDPRWAAGYVALALTGNAVSGRATFALGLVFALGAVAVAEAGHAPSRLAPARVVVTAGLAGLATAASPVAGLFLGLLAAALWLGGRRLAAVALGLPPVLVVTATAVVFPFSGVQPISWRGVALPLVMTVAGVGLLPRGWRTARICSGVYAAAVLLVWWVPTPIGTNVTRLSLIFGGVLLVAAASGRWWTSLAARWLGRRTGRLLLAGAIVTATVWQVVIVSDDLNGSSSAALLDLDVQPLVAQLEARGAGAGRVEVVPSESHREASALAPYVNLARGWNRQADVARNPLFYGDDPLTASTYHRWLLHWGVREVVLPSSPVDYAGRAERALVRDGLQYLHEVWTDSTWTLYEVSHPRPMVSGAARLVAWDSSGITVQVPSPGSTTIRIAWSPWLAIVSAPGGAMSSPHVPGGCLASQERLGSWRTTPWVVLHASRPGAYHIEAPYRLPRGTPCSR